MLKQHPLKYENPSQFTFHTIKVILSDGSRSMIYFKRMPQAEYDYQPGEDTLYTQIQKFIQFKQKETKNDSTQSEIMDSGEFPLNRTIILVSFDHEIEQKTMMKVFSLNGKVRRVFTGSMRIRTSDLDQEDANLKINEKKKKVYVGLVVYKNEFDLTKCFELETFQGRIKKKCLSFSQGNNKAEEKYLVSLLNKYEIRDEKKDKYVDEAIKAGFEIVTDKNGNFELDQEPQEFQSKAARKRKQSKQAKEQIEAEALKLIMPDGDKEEMKNKGINRKGRAKELLKAQKLELQQGFEEDKQKLQSLKKIKTENN